MYDKVYDVLHVLLIAFQILFFRKVPHVPQVLTLTVAEEFLNVAVAAQDRSSSIAYKLFLGFQFV